MPKAKEKLDPWLARHKIASEPYIRSALRNFKGSFSQNIEIYHFLALWGLVQEVAKQQSIRTVCVVLRVRPRGRWSGEYFIEGEIVDMSIEQSKLTIKMTTKPTYTKAGFTKADEQTDAVELRFKEILSWYVP
jgi:hypothetical protein